MRLSPLPPKRALLPAALFVLGAVAQNDNNDDEPQPQPPTTRQNNQPQPQPTTNQQQPNPRPTTQNQNQPQPPQTTTQRNNDPPPPPATEEEPKPTEDTKKDDDKEEPPTEQQPTTRDPVTLTGLPGLGTNTPQVTISTLTGMPTLTRAPPTGTYSYPPPTIPPTRDAPFMNHSTLPDGTVFIAVGAILGAFGVAILLWRAIVACLLHRSIKNAALAQHAANNGHGKHGKSDKNAASFPAPPAQFYKYTDRDSSPSLAGGPGGAGGTTGRRSHRGPTPSATPSQTNLFFSPTAAGPSSGLGANRNSSVLLPSGFYAASTAASANNHHAHGNSISMSTLRPSSRGRAMGPSPPGSPDIGPRVVSRNFSSSSLNLAQPPPSGTRAPSAYLDDLLDEQPGLFPPAGGPTSPRGDGSQRGRY
ncbi:hypothetical protein VTJ83DRAFT_3535 [Remersonia thermophila]|uniref:Uncharacterized protein n=1 Tax=Remersonia thermophila TaxID=72144 RepID=A0ABR4DEE0_9PEZI